MSLFCSAMLAYWVPFEVVGETLKAGGVFMGIVTFTLTLLLRAADLHEDVLTRVRQAKVIKLAKRIDDFRMSIAKRTVWSIMLVFVIIVIGSYLLQDKPREWFQTSPFQYEHQGVLGVVTNAMILATIGIYCVFVVVALIYEGSASYAKIVKDIRVFNHRLKAEMDDVSS